MSLDGSNVAHMADARAQRLVLLIAILASFVAFLDGTVVNVALPAMHTSSPSDR